MEETIVKLTCDRCGREIPSTARMFGCRHIFVTEKVAKIKSITPKLYISAADVLGNTYDVMSVEYIGAKNEKCIDLCCECKKEFENFMRGAK